MTVEVTTNFDIKAKEITSYAEKLSRKYLNVAMFHLLNEVANRAVGDFMIATSSIEDAVFKPVDSERLTVRTGRLARSILSTPNFNYEGLPASEFDALSPKPKIYTSTVEKSEGYKKVIINSRQIDGIIGTETFYAAVHEKGGSRVPARPYLQPAAEASMGVAREIFRQAIELSFEEQDI